MNTSLLQFAMGLAIFDFRYFSLQMAYWNKTKTKLGVFCPRII